jgi:acyl-coenzyme A synthetase/AMP-(fatty) acid ligase
MPSSNADALGDPRHPVTVGKHALPHEHEQLLRAQPAADDVCVIGGSGPVVGERIDARVVPVEGATVTRREVHEASRPATRRPLGTFHTSRAAFTPSR